MTVLTSVEWDDFLDRYPDAHILQTAAWGELKSAFGWSVERLMHEKAGAQILFRRFPLGFHLAYIPKGPVGTGWNYLWPQIDELCRARRTIFLKVEPDLWEDTGLLANRSWADETEGEAVSVPRGFRLGFHSVQPARTILVDLSGDEDQLLGRMKQKTRYNIRLAQKKGVVVHPSQDIASFSRLMGMTGQRDGFGVHSQEYYRQAYTLFAAKGQVELLLAEYGGEPLAGLMVFARGKRAWYFYGASSDQYRETMPTYLLQWEAMRWARERGCLVYDLWGVPDVDESVLEAGFTQRSGGLWGVYRFKRGFGGELRRSAGPWDRVYYPWLYSLYRWWINRRGGDAAG